MKFFSAILFFLSGINLFAQTNISGIINSYAKVLAVYYACPDSLLVSTTSGFSSGDSIIIFQMKGASIDTTNSNSFGSIIDFDKAGNFEVVKINSVNGNTIVLTTSLMQFYDPFGSVQIISYPNYTKADVIGTLTAQPWNGNTGGVLAFSVNDTLLLNADIDASGSGFKGGDSSQNYTSSWFTEFSFGNFPGSGGGKGEGISEFLIDKEYGRGSQANGGGGGMDVNTGAAGGGNYGAGGHGGNNFFAPDTLWGLRGLSLDTAINQNKIFLGGGGGGGHQDSSQGTSGENGGGIIFIRATVITGNNHLIKSNGKDVLPVALADGAGGGGGGGSIMLNVKTFYSNIFIEAKGGKGGDQIYPTQCFGNGGGGGGGVILFADSVIPINVITSVSGGQRGSGQCNNTINDAADGDSGIVKFKWIIPQQVIVNAGPDLGICTGSSVQVGTSSLQGLQYLWNNGINTATQTINPLSNTVFALTVTDGLCHYGYDSVFVSVYPNPITSVVLNINCGAVFFSNNSGTNSYKWYFGDGDSATSTSPLHTYLNSGSYQATLIATSVNGCTTTSTQSVSINIDQQPAMSYNNVTCDPVFHFFNQSIYTIASRWNFGDGDSSNSLQPFHAYDSSGTKQVELITTSQSGCIDTVRQNINVYLRTPARFEYLIDSCAAKILFTSKSPAGVTHLWDFGDNGSSTDRNPVHNYLSPGDYNVSMTINTTSICPTTITTNVQSPSDGFYTLYIPNSFTPNGDGNNETFKIISEIPCDNYTLQIFNRWGEEVFKTDDPINVEWDGNFNGQIAEEGVYVYLLRGTKAQKTGHVILER